MTAGRRRPGDGGVRREGDPDGAADHRAGPADRPGEISGIGPVDPALARDLAAAAARNPKTTWCVTVTDSQGHAIGHGCARPEPKSHQETGGTRAAGRAGSQDGPGFTFTATSQHGPPGGYGTWRLRTPGNGPDLLVTLDPIPAGDCDHRFQARGHDPGVKLRHLTQVRNATCTGPGLPPARHPVRLRAQHPVRSRRENMPV